MIAPREPLMWLGVALGLLCFGATAHAGPPTVLYAASGWPSPEAITAYAAAICGAIVTAANTIMLVWHRLQQPPRKPRKRKVKHEAKPADPGPAPAAP